MISESTSDRQLRETKLLFGGIPDWAPEPTFRPAPECVSLGGVPLDRCPFCGAGPAKKDGPCDDPDKPGSRMYLLEIGCIGCGYSMTAHLRPPGGHPAEVVPAAEVYAARARLAGRWNRRNSGSWIGGRGDADYETPEYWVSSLALSLDDNMPIASSCLEAARSSGSFAPMVAFFSMRERLHSLAKALGMHSLPFAKQQTKTETEQPDSDE